MIKYPLPEFTAAYASPSVDKGYITIGIVIALIIALYFYVDYKISKDAKIY